MDIVIDVAALAVAAARPWRTEARPRRLPPPETSRRSIVQWQRRLVCSSMNQRLRRKIMRLVLKMVRTYVPPFPLSCLFSSHYYPKSRTNSAAATQRHRTLPSNHHHHLRVIRATSNNKQQQTTSNKQQQNGGIVLHPSSRSMSVCAC